MAAPPEEIKQQQTKRCKTCNEEKTLDQYYKAGKYALARCKKCHNLHGYTYMKAKRAAARAANPPKLRGFAALPEEKQRIIIDGLAAKEPMMQIAFKSGVHLDKLRIWKREGKIILPAPPAPAQ